LKTITSSQGDAEMARLDKALARGTSYVLSLAICSSSGIALGQTRQFTLKNSCTETVWVAGAGNPVPAFNGSSGGYELLPGATVSTSVTLPWVGGRFWGRRQCTFDSTGKGSCATGDCGGLLQCQHAGAGNTSLAEFTLTGSATGADNYDISLVDAFDFPLSVELNDPRPAHAINAACQVDLRTSCPVGQQILDKTGNVVACNSLCGKYGTPNYCCAGPYGNPQACNNVHWDTNYRGSNLKQSCPTAYGYAFDDASSDFGVAPPPAQGYTITFCPAKTVPNADPQTVPTFSITSLEQSQTVVPGTSVAYHLNVTAGPQFSGTVTLSSAHLPGSCNWTTAGKVTCSTSGSSASFDRPTVVLTPGATVPVTLVVKTGTNPAPMPGTGNIEVIGQSGAVQNVWEGSVTIAVATAPDYALDVTPASPQIVTPGATVAYNITLTPVNGFTGVVSLASYGLPAGSGTFGPQQFNFTGSGGAQTTTFTLATAPSASKRIYYPLITSFSANRLHDFQTSLTLSTTVNNADFVLSAAPASSTVVAGKTTQFTIQATPQSGFTGGVTLLTGSLPIGISSSFSPASITGNATSTLTLSANASVLPGAYAIPVVATSGSLSHTLNLSLVVQSAGIQLTDLDIGAPLTQGSLTSNNGTYTVTGSGSDIWGASDQFNYAYQAATGDVTITTRVALEANTDVWAKAGVMVRASTVDNAAFAGVFATPGNGVAMIVRSGTGVAAVDLSKKPGAAPVWVRLQRSGNTFTGFTSQDGVSWTLIATKDIAMTSAVTTGLAVTSKRASTLNISTFDNLSIQSQ
jgi:regulation of enolase protein 1 (concanavalin A-like superfamily)